MALSGYNGRWKSDAVEGDFDAYMKEIGVGLISRKLASTVSSVTIEVAVTSTTITIKVFTIVKNMEESYTFGVDKEEKTPDGREYRATVTLLPDGKIVKTMRPKKADLHPHTLTRWLEGERIVELFECNGLSVKRVFHRE